MDILGFLRKIGRRFDLKVWGGRWRVVLGLYDGYEGREVARLCFGKGRQPNRLSHVTVTWMLKRTRQTTNEEFFQGSVDWLNGLGIFALGRAICIDRDVSHVSLSGFR